MDFLKNHFEKLALAIALVALMGVAVFLMIRVGQIKSAADMNIQPGKKVRELDLQDLDRITANAEAPSKWAREKRLFTPPVLAWVPNPRTGIASLAPPGDVPQAPQSDLADLEWLKKYKLPNVPGVAERDPDKDGFTNKEEYDYKTDPSDAESFPALTAYLVVDRLIQREFQLRFLGYSRSADDKLTFQINVRALDFTYFNRLGEQIASGARKENYKIEKFEEASEEYYDAAVTSNRKRDVSRLTLRRLDDGTDIVLTYRQIAVEKSLAAVLRNKLERSERQVREVSKGMEFTVRDTTYKVVDIRTDAVIISDAVAQQEHTLPAVSP